MPNIVIDHNGVRREIYGSFRLQGFRKELELMAQQIQDALSETEGNLISFEIRKGCEQIPDDNYKKRPQNWFDKAVLD